MYKSHWTSTSRLGMVLLLFLSMLRCVIGADTAEDLKARLAENELALQTVQERALELQSDLIRREKELEELRAEHARVILDYKTLRDEYGALRLKGANLLGNADDLSTAKTLEQVLRDLDNIGSLQRESLLLLADYGRSVHSALDLLGQDADSPVRRLLKTREDVLLRKLQETERLAMGSGRTDTVRIKQDSQVMAVNDELGILVLDAGRDQGALPGSIWQLALPNGNATVQIIEARPSLSAAIVITGKLSDIAPGTTATRQPAAQDPRQARP